MSQVILCVYVKGCLANKIKKKNKYRARVSEKSNEKQRDVIISSA